jgi:predicted nuclease with TOPRIM domain
MDYEQIARYIRNNGVYTGNMVDRLCEIIEDNQRSLQELHATNEDLEFENKELKGENQRLVGKVVDFTEEIQDFRQWVTSLQGEVSDLTERLNNV